MPHGDSQSVQSYPNAMSKTAIWVAAARAIGAREPDASVRNPDSLAELLLGDPARLPLDHPVVDALGLDYEVAMQDIEVADTVRAMNQRARFIDEALEHAIAAGAAQLLVLGSGLDSHAWRFQELLAPVAVFEADRPATIEFKRRRADEALGGAPENLVYVPVDFQTEALAGALGRHGYELTRQTFVIMEGVTMYLTEEALRETFAFIAAHPPGSSVVFDYATRAIIEGMRRIDIANVPPAARPSLERLLKMIEHEPWMFGFVLDTEADFLAGIGLTLGERLTIGSEEGVSRYLTRADGTTVGAETHARAEALRDAAQAYAAERMPAEQRDAIEARMREQRRQTVYRIAEAFVG